MGQPGPHRYAAAWGECAGSGSKPYLTGIDLTEPAFKCNCPSRVFPCKHGAALLLLLARQPATVRPPHAPPAWLAEWLDQAPANPGRKKAAKPTPKARKPAKLATGRRSDGGFCRGLGRGKRVENATCCRSLEVDTKRLARMSAREPRTSPPGSLDLVRARPGDARQAAG